MHRAIVGLDVGSTTVKAVVVDPETKDIIWSDYQRHHTKQAECVLDFMVRIGQILTELGCDDVRVFITGSGATPLEAPLGAKFVQEVKLGHVGRRDAAPRCGVRRRAGRSGREDHRLQGEQANRRQVGHRIDERQVRVGYGRHHRQVHDQGRDACR